MSDLVQGHEYRQHQNVIKNRTVRAGLELLCTFVVSLLLYTDCSLIESGNFYTIQIGVIGLYLIAVQTSCKTARNFTDLVCILKCI